MCKRMELHYTQVRLPEVNESSDGTPTRFTSTRESPDRLLSRHLVFPLQVSVQPLPLVVGCIWRILLRSSQK